MTSLPCKLGISLLKGKFTVIKDKRAILVTVFQSAFVLVPTAVQKYLFVQHFTGEFSFLTENP